MVVDKGKKKKVSPDEEFDHVDEELLIAIEKLQELQDDLDKVSLSLSNISLSKIFCVFVLACRHCCVEHDSACVCRFLFMLLYLM